MIVAPGVLLHGARVGSCWLMLPCAVLKFVEIIDTHVEPGPFSIPLHYRGWCPEP
jgi:hypothetical protein